MRFSAKDLTTVRRAYARQMLAIAGVADNPALEAAFADVPRERFIGPPPWQVVGPRGYRPVPSHDPVVVYQDVNFALSPGRGVNNGSPFLHALWLNALGPLAGARVVHVGAGTGYYSAILSRLVGDRGRILAVECDPELARLAERNLESFDNVSLVEGDGASLAFEAADAVYVNFAVARPAKTWIDALAPGGRLIFPLGAPGRRHGTSGGRHADGGGFRIERRDGGFAAAWLGRAFFVCADGVLAPLEGEREALNAAFESGGAEMVRSLRWMQPAEAGRCWFIGKGWSLSYDEVG